jgi:hypothetical protein
MAVNLETLKVIDDVLDSSDSSLESIQQMMLQLQEQSTGLSEEETKLTPLATVLEKAREHVGDLELIHTLLFAIKDCDATEMHRDIGEYVVLYYPITCSSGQLRTCYGDVDVKQNRMVVMNCTEVEHQQVTPNVSEIRYSVAFKFRLKGKTHNGSR